MIKAALSLILLLTAGAYATPPPLVEEDFEGSQFPPALWTTGGYGPWGWSNPGGYAEGYANVTAGNWSETWITSRPFRITAPGRIRAAFRYETDKRGDVWTNYFIEILREGFSYGESLNTTSGWEDGAWITPYSPTGTDITIRWLMTVEHQYNNGTGLLRLDDVVLTAYNISVSPTSIGRVKALYY